MLFYISFLFTLFWLVFRSARNLTKKSPITVAYTLPVLKNTIAFIFNGLDFLDNARRDLPGSSTIQIPIFQDDIYLARGPKNCTSFFQNPHLIVTRAYSLVLQHCFGMEQRSVNAYITDTSGSRPKLIPGSDPNPNDRISFMTHNNLVKGLLQDGLEPAAARFMSYFAKSLEDEQRMHEMILGDRWRDEMDLSEFFQLHIGSSLIKTLFGEMLLEDNPNFLHELWEYDKNVIKLIQRFPSFWIKKTYKIRDSLKTAVRRWHDKAMTDVPHHDHTYDTKAGDLWGTKMIKERYHMLINTTGQDEDSVASTDLAFIWASVTNVVPSTTTLALHTFKSPRIIAELQFQLSRVSRPPTFKEVESISLLNSLYAETLRYGVQIHIPRTSPYSAIQLGGTTVPRNKLILTNTWFAHTDDDVWNTQSGKHPLDEFWAERFLIDPHDETSGPTKTHNRNKPDTTDPYFSTEGLEGAWIPFGGGQHACPGRLLAKHIIVMTMAHLINNFNIEIDHEDGDKSIDFSSERFGFGVKTPRGPVRFRIRRRK